ncbi:MAG: PPOX class F420-dependent oxidoreductase [Solirubrobacterales bacterium]|nr:PPOX class F420-dependent oxidoreductase [Solirubrobacterales bacterium]
MPRRMSDDEWRTFVSAGTRTGKLATVRRDGRPHVVPIWFVLDGEDLVLTTHERSLKGKALRRDDRVALCVDDERPPFAFVAIEGRATLVEDPDELLRFSTLIGARYMGGDRAEEFGKRNGVPGELLVRVRPTNVLAQDDVAGYD